MKVFRKVCSGSRNSKYVPKKSFFGLGTGLKKGPDSLKSFGVAVKSIRWKSVPVMIVFIAVIACAIGGTIAYLTATSADVANTFETASVTSKVVEEFSGTNKTSVQVQNTGDIDAYIRVAVIANSVDADGNITGSADISSSLYNETDWLQVGDYYYYIKALDADDNDPSTTDDITTNLLKANIDLTGKQVTVVADAIQAKGKTSAGDPAVKEAWKDVTIDASGNLVPSSGN